LYVIRICPIEYCAIITFGSGRGKMRSSNNVKSTGLELVANRFGRRESLLLDAEKDEEADAVSLSPAAAGLCSVWFSMLTREVCSGFKSNVKVGMR